MADSVTVYSPWTREPAGDIEFTRPEELERHLEEMVRLRKSGPLKKPERIAILERASAIISSRAEDLARLIALEGGKPYRDALVEAHRAAASVKSAAETLASAAGREIPMGLTDTTEGYRAYTRLEPIGPAVAFSAFNHPLNLVAHQVAPAVAAGCPVLIKPSLSTPLSCAGFIDILREAGLPEPWARCIIINNAEAGTLARDPRIAFFSFIGSARVGWALRSQLAPGVRCSLEHGGCAPAIVAADADLQDAATRLARGGYYHAGQVCVSTQRIYVDARVRDAFTEALGAVVEALQTGDPQSQTTDVGPLIHPREVERVDQWVQEAIASGATCRAGGSAFSETAYRPTLLENPGPQTRISREEIFGPVVAVYPYETIEHAITASNNTPWAFQAAVFTKDLATAELATHQLNASTVMVNEHTAFRTDWMPFAGWSNSGHDTGGIPHSFDSMTREKLVVTRI